MSDTMTIACLLMPRELWRHDDLQFAQVNARMIEAANLIESLSAELAKAREAMMSLRSRLDHHMGDTDPSDPSDPDLVAMQKASEALAAKGATNE